MNSFLNQFHLLLLKNLTEFETFVVFNLDVEFNYFMYVLAD